MAGFKADTTAFFDDSVRNVAAAKQAGIFSVLVGDTVDSILLRPTTDLAPFVNSSTVVISVELSLGFLYDCWRRFSVCALAQAVSQQEAILHCSHFKDRDEPCCWLPNGALLAAHPMSAELHAQNCWSPGILQPMPYIRALRNQHISTC